MAKQLTIFVENRPGRIKAVAETLCEAGLNVWAFTIQDRGQFGLMKVIVDKPKDAQLALEDTGHACALKDVLAVTAADQAGNLNKLAGIFLRHEVNIADAYGFVPPVDAKKEGICFIELKDGFDCDIEGVLKKEGFTILSDEELYEL